MHPLQLRAVKTMETIVIEHYLSLSATSRTVSNESGSPRSAHVIALEPSTMKLHSVQEPLWKAMGLQALNTNQSKQRHKGFEV